MGVFGTKINRESSKFEKHYRAMEVLLEKHEALIDSSQNEGPEKHQNRHQEQGKMLARDRINKLLDSGTDFWELMPLAGLDQKDVELGGSIVGGIGTVSGTLCVINANVPTIKGGALNHVSLAKIQRLDVIARENRLPTIYLTESAGANLEEQALVYNMGGAVFREISRRSKLGIPNLTIVFGNSTAGGAYIPGMSDYVIMVKEQARVFLAGPPLVKVATGEEVDEETLGGAEMHSRLSGVSDFLAENEEEAIGLAREIFSQLNLPPAPKTEKTTPSPKYDPDEILGIIPEDLKFPLDPREIIARVVDGSEFTEFKPLYGPTLVTGYARIHGFPVGIIANNGVLVSEAANKGAHFIQLCNQDQRPILFLQNITGFMVGRKFEQEGIIKNGAKMINAVSNSRVPAITIMMGASYGAGNYAMCGRAYEPRFLFSWPNSKLAVMGPQQLAGVMESVRKREMKRSGVNLDEKLVEQIREETIRRVEYESSAYYATSRVWDDGVIDPRDTRDVVGNCLKVIHLHGFRTRRRFGVFRM